MSVALSANGRRLIVERQCSFCGRRGTRGFVKVDGHAARPGYSGPVLCLAVRACRRRRGKE